MKPNWPHSHVFLAFLVLVTVPSLSELLLAGVHLHHMATPARRGASRESTTHPCIPD